MQKLTYDRPEGRILYHTTYNPYFKQNIALWNASDFIAALTLFIPPWGVRCIRCYGVYFSRCKARWQRLPHVARVAPLGWKDSHGKPLSTDAPPAKTQTVPQRARRSAWARLIAVITDPAEVGRILRHLIKIGRPPPGLDPGSLL